MEKYALFCGTCHTVRVPTLEDDSLKYVCSKCNDGWSSFPLKNWRMVKPELIVHPELHEEKQT